MDAAHEARLANIEKILLELRSIVPGPPGEFGRDIGGEAQLLPLILIN